MTWLRLSDTAASHPVVLAPFGLPVPDVALTEHDVVNLLFGAFGRLATQSAGYRTDYVVAQGVLVNTLGANWRAWVDLAQRAGYLSPVDVDGAPAWRLLDDPTNLAHIRLAADIEWEAQRKKDAGNPALIVPVRLRDGDGCRFCGRVVVWGDQRGARGGTYDHRVPGKAAESPDDLRVACRQCNAQRGNDPKVDRTMPALPAPVKPYYSAKTRAWLAEHGHRVPASRQRPRAALAAALDTATRPATADPAPPATPATPAHRAATPLDVARPNTGTALRDLPNGQTTRDQVNPQDQEGLVSPASRQATRSGAPGRDGTGREPVPGTRRRRARRGRAYRLMAHGQAPANPGALDHGHEEDPHQP